MIFATDNAITKILNRQKTQTRRPVKSNHEGVFDSEHACNQGKYYSIIIFHKDGRDKTAYQVGKTYAVQPGRGRPGVVWYTGDNPLYGEPRWDLPADGQNILWQPLRIRILTISCQDVRNVSLEEARAEGYDSVLDFLCIWLKLYDPRFLRAVSTCPDPDALLASIQGQSFNNYLAWALTFEIA